MMVASPPGSPDALTRSRPQSQYGATSPDGPLTKQRPQSAIIRPPRSNSRMSQSSKQNASRMSDEDGKTSVKVAVRVRPPLGPADPGFDLIPQRFQKSMVQVTTPTSLGVDSPQGRKLFIFDRVFAEDTTQKGVWDYLQDSVESFLQGYNVSILAYGQSGSGKSHTMGTSGPQDQRDPSTRGVIPRAAQHMFDTLGGHPAHSRTNSGLPGLKTPNRYSVSSLNQVMQAKNASPQEWEMTVTYVEIYNEQPRDLLLPEATPLYERPNVQIREDPRGRIFVEGLKSVKVNSIDELMGVLNHGSTIRQTDATAINARSSRSHAVFTINLRRNKPQAAPAPPRDKRASMPVDGLVNADGPMMTVESKLHFVDLAGSERLKNTQATGDRAREGISINAGLASLGKVISQLSTRSAGMHVSYRDSKLTRMLQDSLGGNAITYMIACVTPAEFHLSETLNTVQYAQRARNIQSKPKIQQINDDGDKQAVIDRLRQEVAFLRQQIRSTESGERRPAAIFERMDRSSERESDLQNQLLDVQESYTTLSQRHARLISELAKSGEDVGEISSVAGESAVSRLKRSQAQQQQIEQMVLEYEKTIQTLEANLSNTRSHLSTTESSLLERETKCAYSDTMNHQLNTRVQKLMDRESNMEQYVHDLEARLEDQSSGSEKNDAILTDLRKEIARIRESEGNAEDYICTLEERLAEADQDMEIMQREVERLEHLVERQRSLGKLDNLLYELDHVQRKDGQISKATVTGKKGQREGSTPNGMHSPSLTALSEGAEDIELPEEDQDDLETPDSEQRDQARPDQMQTDTEGLQQLQKATALSAPRSSHIDEPLPSPAQEKFVAEKFENLSHELFDLRIEHESTVNQLELMSAKYQEALRALAELQQDRMDESRHAPEQQESDGSPMPDDHPATFLEDARTQDSRNGGHLSSSRSLSSELSLAGESHTSTETDITPVSKQQPSAEIATREIERLQTLLADHEREKTAVAEQYVQLQAEHKDVLGTVEKLRSEVSRATRPASPSTNNMPPGVLRRMTSQLNSGVDRGQRSIVSLRAMLAEELDGKTDRLEAAEVHLSSVTHELQLRKDRIDALEAEVKNAKKEMEMKTTIISGLTRERNSMKAGSPVDLSMVSQMRDQLIQKETELKSMHESYYKREQELRDEVQHLSTERSRQLSPSVVQESSDTQQRLRSLEAQLQDITEKHDSAKNLADESARQLTITKSDLDAALTNVETIKASNRGIDGASPEPEVAAIAFKEERSNYEQLINELKNALDDQQSLTASQKEKIAELVQLHTQMSKDATALSTQLKLSEVEVAKVRPRIAELEAEIKETKSAVEFHKHGLKSLHDAHGNEVEEMKLSHAGQLASYDDTIAELTAKLDKLSKSYSTDVSGSRGFVDNLVREAQQALGHPTTADMLANHIQDLAEEKLAIAATVKRLQGTNTELERQLTGRQNLQELEAEVDGLNTKIANYQDTIRNLANEVGNHEEAIRDRDTVIKKHETTIEGLNDEKTKKTNLIEELEQQLQNSFDQHHNRVSVIQAQGNQALVEAQHRILLLEKDLGDTQRASFNESEQGSRTNTMKSQRPQSPPVTDSQQRSNSLSSNLRKSASIASLPSPPPAIPLPPLPTLPGIQSATASNPSPPQSRHTSKEVTLPPTTHSMANKERDSASVEKLKRQSALIEEQEGRIRTVEKHLHAEKQLTATLEEALVDLETQSNKLRADAEGWKKKAWSMEEEISGLKKEKKSERLSVQAVEEEVKKRREAEAARAQLEERMRLLTVGDGKKKKKGGGLNCF